MKKVSSKVLLPLGLVLLAILVAGGTYLYMTRTHPLSVGKEKVPRIARRAEASVPIAEAGFTPLSPRKGRARPSFRPVATPHPSALPYASDPFDGAWRGAGDIGRIEDVLLKLNKQIEVMEVLARMSDLWKKIEDSGMPLDRSLLSEAGIRLPSRPRPSFQSVLKGGVGGALSLLPPSPPKKKVSKASKKEASRLEAEVSVPDILGAFRRGGRIYLVVSTPTGVRFVSTGEAVEGFSPVRIRMGSGEVRVVWVREGQGRQAKKVVRVYAF